MADILTCSDTARLLANLPEGVSGLWTTNAPDAIIFDPTSETTQVSGLLDEVNTFFWTLSTQNCQDYSIDSLRVILGEGPIANNDHPVCRFFGYNQLCLMLFVDAHFAFLKTKRRHTV